MTTPRWEIPEGLRVLPDGSWRVGEQAVGHPAIVRYLKSHLVFEDGQAFVVEGSHRMAIQVDGPPFEVVSLVVDPEKQEARVVLDDGSEETVRESSLGMDEATGRFECAVRGGQTRATFSRAAHQTLLQHVEEDDGAFFLRAGARRLPVRT